MQALNDEIHDIGTVRTRVCIMTREPHSHDPSPPKRPLPRSFKELTPANHFNPRTFFYEMVWKAWLTPRNGQHQRPAFPKLKSGDVAITWIGHASFLIQFTDLNVLVDPNFANWLFLLKRLKRSGLTLILRRSCIPFISLYKCGPAV